MTEQATQPPQTTVSVSVPDSRIASLLCTAFEGGSTATWCRIMGRTKPDEPRPVMDGEEIWPTYDYPLCGGATICRLDDGHTDETDKKYTPLVLDRAAIERGLGLMANKQPRHFAHFMCGVEDAYTGDVFVQLALLGEVVYG